MDSAEHSADEAGAVDRVLRLLATPEELAARRSAVIAAVAFLAAIGTTQILRWMMRKRAPGLAVRRAKFARSGQIQGPPAIKVWS